jgi:hypothetical protein
LNWYQGSGFERSGNEWAELKGTSDAAARASALVRSGGMTPVSDVVEVERPALNWACEQLQVLEITSVRRSPWAEV